MERLMDNVKSLEQHMFRESSIKAKSLTFLKLINCFHVHDMQMTMLDNHYKPS